MHETLCFSRQSASPNVDDLPLRCDGCETVSCVVGSFSDHGRIILGPWSDRFRIVNGVSSVFRACAVDRIPLWFATVGSFPQCKWDCKWCWWMSCRWSFEGSLARNAFLALVIFLLKILLKSASKSSFFRSGVDEIHPVLELQFPTPLRVVLLCFATQSPQIALEWLRQGVLKEVSHEMRFWR